MFTKLLIPMIVLVSLSCDGADYYVDSVNGNDTWKGTEKQPWKTLSKINETNFNPGDQIFLKKGSVFHETLSIPSSGDYSKDLYIGSYGSGNIPIITGADIISFYQSNPSENILLNSSFEENLSDWVVEGDVGRIIDPRYGQYAAKLDMETVPSIQQTFVLQHPKDYIFSIHHHEEEIEGHYDAEIVVYLIHNTNPPRYWNNGWSEDKSPAIHSHKPEWDVESLIFPSEEGSESYSVTVTVDKAEKHEHVCVDGCCMVLVSQVYESYIANEPRSLFLTHGNEVIQLYKDDGNFPSYLCWDWNDGILRVNMPYIPDSMIEASMRESNITFNGNSFITVENIKCEKAYGPGINLSYGIEKRPTNLLVNNCQIYHSGTCGILSGYRPDKPEPTKGLTPSYISITNCDIFAYACDGMIRYPEIPWYKGTPVTSAGISVTRGDWNDSGVNCGNIVITGNNINGNLSLINYSTGRNGISINMGNNVLISDNNVTQTDHAISVTGSFGTFNAGDVQHFEIDHNKCHDNGDDGIWIYGMATTNNKICNNKIYHCMDNGIDLMSCTNLIEIYDNAINHCVNESICIWGHVLGCADIHHNTLSNWGEIWKSGNPGKKRGCAIGIGKGLNPSYSNIDYNIYQDGYNSNTAKYPFSLFEIQQTWDMWRSKDLDIHSRLVYSSSIKK